MVFKHFYYDAHPRGLQCDADDIMLRKAISGQFLHFNLVSILSGIPLTGLSGAVSGRKIPDNNPMVLLSGNIVEESGGMYRANLFDWDTSGNNIGYYFTAANAIPVTFMVVTIDSTSGHVWPPSGINTIVPPATLSGVVVNSGLNVTVPIASVSGLNAVVPISILSGVIANSGIFASVPIATLSGLQPVSGATVTVPIASVSGLNAVVPPATLSGVVANSGLFVSVPTATLSGLTATANVTLWQGVPPNALISSGRLDAAFNVHTGIARSGTATTIQLDAGVPTGISGVYDGSVITLVAGTGAGRSRIITNMGSSGIAFVQPAWDASGVPDTTTIFTITPITENLSGYNFVASGANAVVPLATLSGVFATVPIATISGTNVVVPLSTLSGIQPISGTTVSVSIASISGVNAVVPPATLSGVVSNSGLFVTVPPATLSGVVANSGLFVTVPISTLSGVQPISGTTVTVPIASVSGINAVVPPSTLSGVVANSGLFVNATASVASGSLYLASGSIFMNTFASGVVGGGSGNIPSAWGNSGAVTVGQNLVLSGYTAATISGQIYPASGTGGTAVVTSGAVWLASGSIEFALQEDLSGIQVGAAKNSLVTAALKLVSRFDSQSGLTYQTDGATVKMTQQVTTSTTAKPITSLGVGQ